MPSLEILPTLRLHRVFAVNTSPTRPKGVNSTAMLSAIAPSQKPPRNMTASQASASPPAAPIKSGILIVTIYEGKGLSSLLQSSNPRESVTAETMPQGTSLSKTNTPSINDECSSTHRLPYALLDFEKSQIHVDAVSGTCQDPLWAGERTEHKFDVTRINDLSIQLYLCNRYSTPVPSDRNGDVLLGECKIKPSFTKDPKADQPEVSWIDLSSGNGSIKIGAKFIESKKKDPVIEDFELLKALGRSSFGNVLQVR
jgi:serum/glucocorticoid-regulated kinase 2